MDNNPHHSGIDLNRLINKESYKNFDQMIKCKICFNILLNPHDCETCGNTFCKECISNLTENKKPCPFNCVNFSIKPSSLSITSFLSSMKFHCSNRELGCESTLTYLQVNTHDKECKYALSSCPNIKCKKQVRRQTLEFHIRKECEYSLFKCPNCEDELERSDFLQHLQNCKVVSDIFNNYQPIVNLDQTEKYDYINLKDLSMGNFMKMILINLAKISHENEKKFDFIKDELNNIKKDLNNQGNSFNICLDNLNSEFDILNERMALLENNISSNENVKKLLEENMKESVIIRDTIFENKVTSKENSNPSTTNNSKNNSAVLNVIKLGDKSDIPTKNDGKSSSNNNTSLHNNLKPTNQVQTVNPKKVNIKPLPKNNNRSPNKSPVQTHSRSPNPKTYNIETESYQIKTSNFTLIKNMIKNQQFIIENLNKIFERFNLSEGFYSREIKSLIDDLKKTLNENLLDEIKCFTLETSLDNSNRIFKKIEEIYSKA